LSPRKWGGGGGGKWGVGKNGKKKGGGGQRRKKESAGEVGGGGGGGGNVDLSYERAKMTERATRGKGILSSVGDTAAELFIRRGIPYLAKKGAEAGRYYASEFMRDPKLQTKTIHYAIKKAIPVIQKVGSEAWDQLSTKVRPNY